MKIKSDYAAGPGMLILFGSGETSPSGRKAFDVVLRHLPPAPRIVLLETPAGFELNSDRVAGRIAQFLEDRLQNYQPRTSLVPARRREGPYSTQDPGLLAPLLEADLIFMGPGSPSYAVRQLRNSLAWDYVVARHRLGAALALASAAAISIGAFALPVYEIYKVGEDLHWKQGLDFFEPYGLCLVFVPHWNNNDGGDELDTSRCFMGVERFQQLIELLPDGLDIVGIDEKTALVINLQAGECQVVGLGGVTVIHTGHDHLEEVAPDLSGSGLEQVARTRSGHVHQYASGARFPLADLGPYHLPALESGISVEAWQAAVQAVQQAQQPARVPAPAGPPGQVLELVEARQAARTRRDWSAADTLREQISALGWQVVDTPEGPKVQPLIT